MADKEKQAESLGTGPHKAVFDISISFRTEVGTDDHRAYALIDALTEYLRANAPGASKPTVGLKES